MLPVTNDEIIAAESCLLHNGVNFDPERRAFIQCLETCDLQAVPGSGKTTALLAKLHVLEKRLPLDGGKGILVISHTNTAIDEIKEKLHGHCNKIFGYPNFIGTIQSFVDEFLAIPYYLQKYKSKPVRIDNEIYEEKALKFTLNGAARDWLRNRHDKEQIRKGLRYDSEDNLTITLAKTHAQFPVGTGTATYEELLRMKRTLMERGYLHFDDAYYLAEKYLIEFPKIVDLLRRRFKYVFVDEMQDMEAHQYNLLEKLFFTNDNSVVFQRIGDRNQSIYGGDNSSEANWVNRGHLLTLQGSHRLSRLTARVVRPFGLYSDTEIVGSYNSDLPPHLMIYEPANRGLVVQRFAELISRYKAEGRFPAEHSHPIKAIGWVGKPSEANNHAFIPDYFSAFNRNNKGTKIDHTNLLSYLLFYDKKKKTFDGIRTSILNAIVWILREENILSGNRDFTKKTFFSTLKRANPNLSNEFNLNLYRWCKSTLMGNVPEVQNQIRTFMPDFLQRWNGHAELSAASITFLTSNEVGGIEIQVEDTRNVFSHDGIDVEVTTVHSVKGQTHSATLYMETFFRSYETQKCLEQMCGTSATGLVQVTKKEAAKILYVGLSRPTNLLCFAASSENIGNDRQRFIDSGWEIFEVLPN